VENHKLPAANHATFLRRLITLN